MTQNFDSFVGTRAVSPAHQVDIGALTAWLERPLERDPRKRRDGEVELRFVLMAEALGVPWALKFLEEAAGVYSAQLAEIETFMAGPGAQMSEASPRNQ